MWISHRKEIRKLTFRALALRQSEGLTGIISRAIFTACCLNENLWAQSLSSKQAESVTKSIDKLRLTIRLFKMYTSKDIYRYSSTVVSQLKRKSLEHVRPLCDHMFDHML